MVYVSGSRLLLVTEAMALHAARKEEPSGQRISSMYAAQGMPQDHVLHRPGSLAVQSASDLADVAQSCYVVDLEDLLVHTADF